jgi:hypothetical protein
VQDLATKIVIVFFILSVVAITSLTSIAISYNGPDVILDREPNHEQVKANY